MFFIALFFSGCSSSYDSGMAGLYLPEAFIFDNDECGIAEAMDGSTQGYRLGSRWKEEGSDTGRWGDEAFSEALAQEGASDILGTFCDGNFPELSCQYPPQAMYFDAWKEDVTWSSACTGGAESVHSAPPVLELFMKKQMADRAQPELFLSNLLGSLVREADMPQNHPRTDGWEIR